MFKKYTIFLRITLLLMCSAALDAAELQPAVSGGTSQERLSGRVDILCLDFAAGRGLRINKSGGIEGNGVSVAARFEGHGTGRDNLQVLNDMAPGAGGAVLHYVCTAQQASDIKARQEHYLHVAPMNRMFFSEFSIKLDPNFTMVDKTRPDGGPNWCILRQWHQSSPESPAISLQVAGGTNDMLCWNINFGDSKGHEVRSRIFGETKVQLGKWYHFRVQWKVSPNADGRCVVFMSDKKLPQTLTQEDLLFRYAGPIGYTLKNRTEAEINQGGGHGGRTIREQQGIYQGPHLAPTAHHGYYINNVAIYTLAEDPH